MQEEVAQVPDADVDLIHRYRAAVERSPLPTVLTVAEEHLVRYANPAFCRLSESPSGAPPGFALPASSGNGGAGALLARVPGRCHRRCGGCRVSCWEGRVFHGTAIVAPLLDERARRGLVVQILDNTEQVAARAREAQAARDLKEANERLIVAGIREQELADQASQRSAELTALLAAMAEGVTVFDATGEVVLVNPVGREMLGFSSESPTLDDYRRCDFQHLDGAPLDFEKDVLSRMLRDEPFAEEEVLLHAPDGRVRHIVLSGSAVRDARGQMALAMNVYRDVTQVRELEQVREQCMSFITHDLRSPLAAAMFSAEVIEMGRAGQTRSISPAGSSQPEPHGRDDPQSPGRAAAPRWPQALDGLGECDFAAIAREVADDLAGFHTSASSSRERRASGGSGARGSCAARFWNLASNALKYGAPARRSSSPSRRPPSAPPWWCTTRARRSRSTNRPACLRRSSGPGRRRRAGRKGGGSASRSCAGAPRRTEEG